eukprot:8940659-Pyramimonas_sp.AAC.1
MAKRHAPADLTAALMRENVGCKLEAVFQGAPSSTSVDFNKCERQGSTDAPAKWNTVMADVLGECRVLYREANLGLKLNS